jgi:ABC-type amino acid transport substrate-binding protein
LTITSEWLKTVDFTDPIYTGVREIVMTGPQSPKIDSLEDLAGQEIFVRKSSSYYESLVQLNEELKKKGKAQAIIS